MTKQPKLSKAEAIKEIEKLTNLPFDYEIDNTIWFGNKYQTLWFDKDSIGYGKTYPQWLSFNIIDEVRKLIPILFKEGE